MSLRGLQVSDLETEMKSSTIATSKLMLFHMLDGHPGWNRQREFPQRKIINKCIGFRRLSKALTNLLVLLFIPCSRSSYLVSCRVFSSARNSSRKTTILAVIILTCIILILSRPNLSLWQWHVHWNHLCLLPTNFERKHGMLHAEPCDIWWRSFSCNTQV